MNEWMNKWHEYGLNSLKYNVLLTSCECLCGYCVLCFGLNLFQINVNCLHDRFNIDIKKRVIHQISSTHTIHILLMRTVDNTNPRMMKNIFGKVVFAFLLMHSKCSNRFNANESVIDYKPVQLIHICVVPSINWRMGIYCCKLKA